MNEFKLVLTEQEANVLCQILDAAAKSKGLELSIGIAVIFQKLQLERDRIEKEKTLA